MRRSYLTARVLWRAALVAGLIAAPLHASAGIPVIDGANFTQTTLTAIESVAQTAKQIQEYQTQLRQYENMLQNTAAPTSYIWDQAQTTMNDLMRSVNTLNYYQNQLGSIDAYLRKFQDANHYVGTPCFTGNTGCSATERNSVEANSRMASESQKKANDDLFKGINQQQQAIKNDAQQLQTLQSAAQGASGQMQAIQYANQLASQQSNQLLQIRGLLVAQQTAIAARNSAVTDREAQAQAANAKHYAVPAPSNRNTDRGF